MTSVLESLQWRYATKKFDSKKTLPEHKIDTLKEAFNLTATSYGLQPLKMVVVKDKELREQLIPCAYGQRQVADASHLLVLCIEKKVDENFIKDYFNRVKQIRNTEDNILDPFKKQLISSFEDKTPEEIHTWASKQVYLALGNLLTVCALEKIDSCPMEGFIAEKFNTILALDELELSAVLLLPVGYRAEDDMFSEFKKVRKRTTETVIDL